MADRAPIGLDDPVFRGRLRRIQATEELMPRAKTPPLRPSAKYFNNSLTAPVTESKKVEEKPIVSAEPVKPVEVIEQAVDFRLAPTPVAIDHIKPKKHVKKRGRSQTALLSMAVIIFVVGILVSGLTLKTNLDAKAQVSALSQDAGDDAPPDETKPGNISNYQVAPNVPKFIKIPSLSVSARVKALDVTKDNALQAPRNIYDAGWYGASAKPGDPGSNGAVLIDGHVHGPTLPGVFSTIKNMKSGDEIKIQRGDDKVFTYIVSKTQNYDSKSLDLGIALTSIQPGMPGLNLITCGGKFDQSTGQYDQRTIVFAVLQS